MSKWTQAEADRINAKNSRNASKKVATVQTQGEGRKTGGKGKKNSEKRHYKYIVGIDPGVNTGFAVIKHGEMDMIKTWRVDEAIIWLKELASYQYTPKGIFVRVEDARKRKWFGKAGREQLQGAGSIKRDCKILEDFLTDLGVDFELVAPKNNKTKLDAVQFKQITGWQGRTSVHARDAAMLIYGLK